MSRNLGRSACAAALLIAMLSALSACGSSGSDSSATSGGESTASSEPTEGAAGTAEAEAGSSGVAAAQKFVSEREDFETLTWPKPPSKAFDPGAGTAKVIVCGTAGAGCLLYGKQAQRALHAAGWSVGELGDGEFTPSVWTELILHAVQEKLDAIVLVAIDPETVESAIHQAEEAGIPMTCIACVSTPNFPAFGGSIPMSSADEPEVGELIANFAIANSDGNPSILSIESSQFTTNAARGKGMRAALAENCSECPVEHVDFPTSELEKPGPPVFSAALAANPDLEWVISVTDTYTIPMVTTAEQQGSEVQFSSDEAEIPYLEKMVNGSNAAGTVWVPGKYLSWSAVDNVLRLAAGEKPWDTSKMPSVMVTKKTAPTVLAAAPEPYSPPNFDFEKMFEEAWSGK